MPPVFGPKGSRVAAVLKDNGRWSMAVDGEAWDRDFDMVWDPVFSPDGQTVAAKVEFDGRRAIAIDGRVGTQHFDDVGCPTFSPDGSKLLVRARDGDQIVRWVTPVGSL